MGGSPRRPRAAVDLLRRHGVRRRHPRSSDRPGRRFVAPVTIAVLAVTVSATAVAFFVLRGHAEQVEERRLGEEAQLGVIAFDSVAQEIESIVAGSNAIAVATDGDPAAFEATLRARTEMSLISSLVLLRVGVDEFRPLSEVGRRGALLPRALGPEFMQRMDEIASAGRLEIVKLATLNEGRVLGLAARAEGAGDYLVYAELLLPEVLSITGSSETPDVRYALYVDEELESSLILSNSDALPIEGRRVTRSLRLGNERPLFVFASNESLAGTFATALPWARSGWGWPSRPSWRASSTQRSAAPARRSTWFTISSRRTPSSIGARSAIVACSRMPTISSSSRTWTESSRRSTGRLGNSSATRPRSSSADGSRSSWRHRRSTQHVVLVSERSPERSRRPPIRSTSSASTASRSNSS